MYESHKTICRFPGATQSYLKVARAIRKIASNVGPADPAEETSSTHSSTMSELILWSTQGILLTRSKP